MKDIRLKHAAPAMLGAILAVSAPAADAQVVDPLTGLPQVE